MSTTLIVFGQDTLITRLPQDYQVQFELVKRRWVFDSEGELVNHMPEEGVWPESYYCVPFAGLTKLLFAIASVLKEAGVCDVKFAFADAVYVGHDVAMRDLLTKCLRAVFGANMPESFDQVYWQTTAARTSSLIALFQKQYFDECDEAGITKLLDEYKRSQEADPVLPPKIAYFYLSGNDMQKSDEDRVKLKSTIDGMKAEPTRDILLHLNNLRLRQSVVPLLNVLKDKNSASSVVFVTSNKSHHVSAEGAGINTVNAGDIVKKIEEGQDEVACLVTNITLQFLVKTILKAVGSPFPVFAAYMHLLQRHASESKTVAFQDFYFGAHFLITHSLFSEAFKQAHEYNHQALTAVFGYQSADLVKMDANEIIKDHQMQRNMEFLIARFTGVLRGKILENRVCLAKIIPPEIIAAFADCQKITGNSDILWRSFLMWCSGQLQNSQAETTGGLTHFLKDLRQIATSYKEKLGLVDRINTCKDQLIHCLSEEIKLYQQCGQVRQQTLTRVADGLVSRTPTSAGPTPEFATPRKPKRTGIHFAGQGAEEAAEMPRSRGESAGSANLLDISNIPLEDLKDLGLTEEEQKHVRIEVFMVSRDTDVKSFLEKRVRLSGHVVGSDVVGRNVSLFYANNEAAFQVVGREDANEEDFSIVAIGYCDGANMGYYRRAAEGADNRSLRKDSPLINLPILLIRTRLLDDLKEIKVIWGASLADVYIGKEEHQLSIVPEIIIPQVINEGSLLGQLCKKIRELELNPRLKPFVREILTAFGNLNLLSKEDDFLRLDLSSQESRAQQLIEDMRTAYDFINKQRMPGLFSFEVTPVGIKAEIDSRGRKLLSLLHLGLNAANGIILLSLIFAFKDSVIFINPGDKFFYLNELNAQLLRAAILTVYVSTPFELVKQLISYLLTFWAQVNFGRTLKELPRNIPNAVIGGSLARQTVVAKLEHSLGALIGSQEDILPLEIKHFVSALHAFALISEESKLPSDLRVIFMNVGRDVASKVMGGRSVDESPEQTAMAVIQAAEKKHLKITGSVAIISAIVAAVFSGIYYSLINTRGNDSELSELTRADLYALGVAALYLLYKFGGNVAEASIGYAASREASLFGGRRRARDSDASLEEVSVNDEAATGNRQVEQVSAVATPETPLLGGGPRPGRGGYCIIQ